MQLTGIHHVTAVTADAKRNLDFYTRALGLRLVKKTVNQDDVSAYHLFYADAKGSPGTDLTFFDWPATRERRGSRSIARTGLRVADVASLQYWMSRLQQLEIAHGEITDRDGRATLDFDDFEGQRFCLVVDGGQGESHPWEKSPVPAEHQIRGLGPVTISVPSLAPTEQILTGVMGMKAARQYTSTATDGSDSTVEVHVFQMGGGGPAGELHVAVEPHAPSARAGAGGVHHVAFRVPTFEQYDQWYQRLTELGVRTSGPVDRFYFRSLYFREPGGILFELATDGPGFSSDESEAHLGERLALPPFLEGRRKQIEAGLKPL